MVLRQRRKPVSEILTELDAFPKVPDTYVEYTLSGAYGEGWQAYLILIQTAQMAPV